MPFITFVNTHAKDVAAKVIHEFGGGIENFIIPANKPFELKVLEGERVEWGWTFSAEGPVSQTPCIASANQTVEIKATCRG